MVEKVLTKKTFVGHGTAGRLAMPGEEIDVDEKTGVLSIAGSTPVGALSTDQLEAELERRRRNGDKDLEPARKFGDNVEDPGEADVGVQRLEMANFRPGDGLRPQGIPPGTEEHNNTFMRPAPEESPAAIEVVTGPAAEPGTVAGEDAATFDHDGDGKAGGAPKGGNRKRGKRK